VVVGGGETVWSFRPSLPWAPGEYSLRVHAALEDRAGNRFDRLFDRDTGAEGQPGSLDPSSATKTFGLAFIVPRP
jgi:hypothetical protein